MTSLLDLMRAPPERVAVDPDGSVVQGEPDEKLTWMPNPRQLYRYAEIELHREPEGWMWSTSWGTGGAGSSYKVGRKWGHFAATREDALHYAIEELRGRLDARRSCIDPATISAILSWAERLR
jgi:hypothetical protein